LVETRDFLRASRIHGVSMSLKVEGSRMAPGLRSPATGAAQTLQPPTRHDRGGAGARDSPAGGARHAHRVQERVESVACELAMHGTVLRPSLRARSRTIRWFDALIGLGAEHRRDGAMCRIAEHMTTSNVRPEVSGPGAEPSVLPLVGSASCLGRISQSVPQSKATDTSSEWRIKRQRSEGRRQTENSITRRPKRGDDRARGSVESNLIHHWVLHACLAEHVTASHRYPGIRETIIRPPYPDPRR
jgi:hypothetical protein